MKTGILISYWNYKDFDLDAELSKRYPEDRPAIFADSGAFSAMSIGAKIDIDKYAEWVNRWQHLFDVYANLDVIKNAELTWANQKYLENKCGLSPLPVFHILESWDWLDRYVYEYSYIALGVAGQQQRKQELMRWLIRCFKIAGNRSEFHGFGLSDWLHLPILPWRTIDSTTWMAGHRYGALLIFAKGKLFQTRAHLLPQYSQDLKNLGFTINDALSATRGNAEMSRKIAIASLERAQSIIKKHNENFERIYLAGDM